MIVLIAQLLVMIVIVIILMIVAVCVMDLHLKNVQHVKMKD